MKYLNFSIFTHFIVLILLVTVSLNQALSADLQPQEHSSAVTHQSSAAAVARQLSNPVSLLWSLNLQNNWTFNKGDLSDGDYEDFYKFEFQPVVPLLLNREFETDHPYEPPNPWGKACI